MADQVAVIGSVRARTVLRFYRKKIANPGNKNNSICTFDCARARVSHKCKSVPQLVIAT